MTQIDSTAQTDLGISDHEELLLPYKAIYSQLLDTLKEVLSQTLTAGNQLNGEKLELLLKDNLNTLICSPSDSQQSSPKSVPQAPLSEEPRVLKILQEGGLETNSVDAFKTTSQLLKLIELNSLSSELSKQKTTTFPPSLLGYGIHKSPPYSSSLCQQPPLFNKTSRNHVFTPKPSSFVPSLLQKQFEGSTMTLLPKIFSPGVIRSEPENKVLPLRGSPQQAFSTATNTRPLFSAGPITSSSAVPNSSVAPNLLLSSAILKTSSICVSSTPSLISSPVTLGGITHGSSLTDMEVHQNFLKQINLLNQAAPSMIGNGKHHLPRDKKPEMEKVLRDIQVNLTEKSDQIHRPTPPPQQWNHTKDKLYKCPHCETSFARRQYLSNHIINVHNLKTCPECKTTFSNEEAFNAHLALHPKKEYECGSCNKSFNSVYLLKNHRKTHVKDKPFACNICGKTFADKYYLRNHFSIHSPVKPYSCPVCGRGFASSSALRYHSFQHTGEKPAKCQYCPSEFVQKNQLKLHIARKHKELISNLNPLHEGDIIPGNISLTASPAHSPASTSSPKESIAAAINPSPSNLMPQVNTSAMKTEPMQTNEGNQKEVLRKPETPLVSTATEQLHELITSLQRKQASAAAKPIEGGSDNFTLTSPFSRITDGINQLLEGGGAINTDNTLRTS